MKKLILLTSVLLILMIGCSSENKETKKEMPEGTRKIEVVEHMNGGGYTFIKGNENGNEIWLAVREMPVENGDVYYFKDAMVMSNFESKSLNRTFESILFVGDISKTFESQNNAQGTEMPQMANSAEGHTKPQVEASNVNVTPLEDGMTVEVINKDKKALFGKKVKIRGVVTKYNSGIMGKNWIHLQDGTSYENSVDITVTSDQPTKLGATIVIEGTVAIDKDFGSGYFYDVIIENATITEEAKS
ncbi:MAG: DNA-binding protein [Ignavibacteriae bacterium]|nr:DNA-binding protein [Ignavibacteriota bacterium]MCB9207057.1 DNA-binding protein [Ignavibacteriales bacterium]MCB9207807.1 DNA-binding protein [Ignavibacteriales bacterium]